MVGFVGVKNLGPGDTESVLAALAGWSRELCRQEDPIRREDSQSQ